MMWTNLVPYIMSCIFGEPLSKDKKSQTHGFGGVSLPETTPQKLTCFLKIDGWFRLCISFQNGPLSLGDTSLSGSMYGLPTFALKSMVNMPYMDPYGYVNVFRVPTFRASKPHRPEAMRGRHRWEGSNPFRWLRRRVESHESGGTPRCRQTAQEKVQAKGGFLFLRASLLKEINLFLDFWWQIFWSL